MPIHLDHLMVPARDKVAAAKRLGELLGVPWSATGVGPFAPVYVSDGFTIDFDEWGEPFPRIHYCFRVGEVEFDAILGRLQAAGIAYRSNVQGPPFFFSGRQPGEHAARRPHRLLERAGRPLLGNAHRQLRAPAGS